MEHPPQKILNPVEHRNPHLEIMKVGQQTPLGITDRYNFSEIKYTTELLEVQHQGQETVLISIHYKNLDSHLAIGHRGFMWLDTTSWPKWGYLCLNNKRTTCLTNAQLPLQNKWNDKMNREGRTWITEKARKDIEDNEAWLDVRNRKREAWFAEETRIRIE